MSGRHIFALLLAAAVVAGDVQGKGGSGAVPVTRQQAENEEGGATSMWPAVTEVSAPPAAALRECIVERDRLLSDEAIRWIAANDELLAKWLEAQRRITDNLADAIGKDPLRADSMLGDYRFLLSQYRAEIGHCRDFPAFDRTKALNVMEFGAAGDGIADDSPAIRKAIAAATAVAGPGRAVFIPKGKYKIGFDPNQPGANLSFKNIDHLLVYGENGTDIHIPQPLAVAVSMRDSNDVRLENLNFVFTKRPFTTGVVLKRLSNDTLRCRIDDGMADPADGMFRECQSRGLMRFYSPELLPGSKRPARSSILPHQGAPKVTKVADGIYDFRMKSFLPLSEEHAPGVRFAFYARTFGNHAFSVMDCTRPRFVNIRLNASSAMAFCFINTERPFVAGCKVEADPDTFVSTSADGVFLRGGALGGLLCDNAIRQIGDDFINIHSLLSPAIDGFGKRLVLKKKQWSSRYLKTGARIGLIPVSQGINEPTIEGRIARLAENEDSYEVTLDVNFGDFVTSAGRGNGNDIPKADFIVLPDDLCHGLVIQGNRFEHGLSRFLAGGRNWLFKGNTVVDSLHHSFFMNICPEPGGQENAEFALPRNIEISRNTFKTLAKTLFNGGTSFNQFRPINPERPTASHIKITDNVIQVHGSSAQPLFNMEHTAFLTVEGNSVAGKRQEGE